MFLKNIEQPEEFVDSLHLGAFLPSNNYFHMSKRISFSYFQAQVILSIDFEGYKVFSNLGEVKKAGSLKDSTQACNECPNLRTKPESLLLSVVFSPWSLSVRVTSLEGHLLITGMTKSATCKYFFLSEARYQVDDCKS